MVDLAPGAVVALKSVKERNAGWAFKDLAEGAEVPEPLAIRGYPYPYPYAYPYPCPCPYPYPYPYPYP